MAMLAGLALILRAAEWRGGLVEVRSQECLSWAAAPTEQTLSTSRVYFTKCTSIALIQRSRRVFAHACQQWRPAISFRRSSACCRPLPILYFTAQLRWSISRAN